MGRTWPGQQRRVVRRSQRPSIPAPYVRGAPAVREVKKIAVGEHTLKVSKVFRLFFWFVCERHRVFQRRLAGEPAPWTDDDALASHPYINVFRVLDRTSQYILTHVIGGTEHTLKDAFFRVLLFRTFNRIDTWEYLEEKRGSLTWDDFDVEEYECLLEAVPGSLYSGAYIMPAPYKEFGYRTNLQNHLRLIDLMMSLKVYDKLKRMKHLKDAHGYLCLFPSMGDFIAMQLVLDLNMLPDFDWDEDEWVALGPGSTACLLKMFGSGVKGCEQEVMRHMRDEQMTYFSQFGLHEEIPQLCPERGPGLTLVDIEHALCECEKYSRVVYPDIKGRRQSAGRKYVPKDAPVTDELPEKWRAPRRRKTWTQPAAVDGDDAYEVAHVVREKNKNEESPSYVIRWAGWGPDWDSVLSEADLESGAPGVVRAWRRLKEEIQDGIDERRI